MAKRLRKPNRTNRRVSRNSSSKEKLRENVSDEAIKAAERVALSAFASGLRMAAVFGTVAAKTTSLVLASLATGADKFSELVKREAMRPSSSRKGANSRLRGNVSSGKTPLPSQRKSRARS